MSFLIAKSIVAFTTDCFDLSWPAGDGDPNGPPLGRDAAEYFIRRLSESGVSVVGNEAVMGEGGWHWNVVIDADVYLFALHWAPIGEPERDFWIIQIRKDAGLLRRLFGKQFPPEEMLPAADAIKRIIDDEPRFTDVGWLTPAEFRSIY